MSNQRILQGVITDNIIAEKRGAIGWLIFNDVDRHNAVSFAMWEAIPKVLDVFALVPEIRAVVLTGGGGKSFVSGANISQFDMLRSGEEAVQEYERVAEAAQLALYDFDKPTVARIEGYCIGGGLNIALCCDIRVTAPESTFSIPAGRLGLGYRLTAIRNLVTVVGAANALEIFLSASRYSAAQARELGLVHKLAEQGALDAALAGYLEKIQANAPLTLKAGKRMIRQMQQIGPEVDVPAMQQLVMDCFNSQDYAEGRKAFAEKRAPVFKGN